MKAVFCLILFFMFPGAEGQAFAVDTEFPTSYAHSRAKLLQLIKTLQSDGVQIESFALKIGSWQGQELIADALYLPPRGKKSKLFILSSGLHGAEAPLGSALQINFLQQMAPRLQASGTGLLIFHALNPWGFASGRRVTENNVDLNRNFFTDSQAFARTTNVAYEKYRHWLAPHEGVRSYIWDRLKILWQLLKVAVRGKSAKSELTQAFAGGQYADPQGIYFGGKTYEPQVEWVRGILSQHLGGYENVLLYDIHTGLGKAGALQMISSVATRLDGSDVQALRKSVEKEFQVAFVSPTTEGFYTTTGDFIDFVYAEASHSARVMAFTAEFGTLGDSTVAQISTSQRMIMENRGQHWGYASPELETRVRTNFAELFNPSELAWRERVLSIGMEALAATFKSELEKK